MPFSLRRIFARRQKEKPTQQELNEFLFNSLFLHPEPILDKVKALVEQGADVNAIHRHSGRTPLIMIAQLITDDDLRFKNGIKVAEFLLSKNANIDAQTPDGVSALMAAAENGNAALVGYLLERGANPCLKTLKGYTAVDFAARQNRGLLCKTLSEAAEKKTALTEAEKRQLEEKKEREKKELEDYISKGCPVPCTIHRPEMKICQQRKNLAS